MKMEKFVDFTKLMKIKDEAVKFEIKQDHEEIKSRTHSLPPVSENYTRLQRMADFMKRYDEGEYDVSGKDVF